MPKRATQPEIDDAALYEEALDQVREMRREFLAKDGRDQAVSISQAQYSFILTMLSALWARDMAVQRDALAQDLDLGGRLSKVERRLGDGAPLKFAGTWQRASDAYQPGNVVTDAGSGWVALKAVPAGVRPGTAEASEFWQLMVKAGRDAVGARA